MTQEEQKFINFIKTICVIVNKNKHFGVSFKNLEYYGIDKYDDMKWYKVTIEHNRGTITFYVEEIAFTDWNDVPCSGTESFRPDDFEEWPEDKQLVLAWCWCFYSFCTRYKSWEDQPPAIED